VVSVTLCVHVCVCPSVCLSALSEKKALGINNQLGRHSPRCVTVLPYGKCNEPKINSSKIKVVQLSYVLPAGINMHVGIDYSVPLERQSRDRNRKSEIVWSKTGLSISTLYSSYKPGMRRNLCANGVRPRLVEHDADLAERVAGRHCIVDDRAVLGDDLDRSVVDDEDLVGLVVLADDVLVTQVVGWLEAARHRSHHHRVGVAEQRYTTIDTQYGGWPTSRAGA